MKIGYLVICMCMSIGSLSGSAKQNIAAEPVWPRGESTTMNSAYEFVCELKPESVERKVDLRYAAASFARVSLDGEFVSFGPARAPTGWHRIEEVPLKLTAGSKHTVSIEVVAYNINTYCESERPGVLQAEITDGEKVIAATRAENGDFMARKIPRIRKVSRYSHQRGFNEAYRLPSQATTERLEKLPLLKLLPRLAPPPDFGYVEKITKIGEYAVAHDSNRRVRENWSADGCGTQKGFVRSEQELCVFEELQRYVVTNVMTKTSGRLYMFDRLETGFPLVRVSCSKPGRVVMRFAEVLSNGVLDPARDCTGNGVIWELSEPGEYDLHAFEPYAFKYVDVIVGDGITAESPRMNRFCNPTMTKARYRGDDPVLCSIFEAARNTIAQCSTDIFMDCPGRERAGWLCDSYFSAKAAQFFSGSTDVERAFLENYEKAERFRELPEGMVAECYPADHPDGSFISNWAMWFIIEVDDYVRRTGDAAFARRLLPRVKGIVDFISKYENSDGLLEKLPSWIFVEWSESNKHVQDVNYPTNMLWAEALDAASRLSDDPMLAARAKNIREAIRRQSFDGRWFHDNSIRGADGKLHLGTATTETCQYYAFWTNTATPDSHATLWNTLTTEFGPSRKSTKKYPEVAYSNAFIGNYLRLMALVREGLKNQVLEEIRGYFAVMAETTGTLWEHDSTHASCCHGFASYVAVLIDECTR